MSLALGEFITRGRRGINQVILQVFHAGGVGALIELCQGSGSQ